MDYADDVRDSYILSDPAPSQGHDEEARVTWHIGRGRPGPDGRLRGAWR